MRFPSILPRLSDGRTGKPAARLGRKATGPQGTAPQTEGGCRCGRPGCRAIDGRVHPVGQGGTARPDGADERPAVECFPMGARPAGPARRPSGANRILGLPGARLPRRAHPRSAAWRDAPRSRRFRRPPPQVVAPRRIPCAGAASSDVCTGARASARPNGMVNGMASGTWWGPRAPASEGGDARGAAQWGWSLPLRVPRCGPGSPHGSPRGVLAPRVGMAAGSVLRDRAEPRGHGAALHALAFSSVRARRARAAIH